MKIYFIYSLFKAEKAHKHSLKMKLTMFLLIVSLFNIQASTYSQNTRISLSLNDATVEEVFHEIESLSEFRFLYNHKNIDVSRRVSVHVRKKPISKILNSIFSGTGTYFKVKKKQIILKKEEIKEPAPPVEQVQEDQTLTVSGTVTEAGSGMYIPGVNIVEQGTTNGVMSDFDGNYSIKVPEDANLEVSYVGYATQQVKVNGRSEIDIVMETEAAALEEVVVIGYGKEKRVNVIGSVSSVSGEEIEAAPVGQISNALAGRLPGAIIQQRSGEPGRDEASILIRGKATLGNASPLVVIDGIPGRDLNSVRASDVESISVLKDASAGIYGARAANGVILITTKRGTENTPATITYDGYQGWMTPTMVPKKVDAATYGQRTRELEWYRGTDESNMTFSLEDIEKYRSGEFPWTHPNTDWFETSLKDFTSTANHNISISGGSNTIQYYTSLGMQKDEGIYKNSATTFERFDLRGNLDYEINDYLNLGLLTHLQQANRMYPTTSTDNIYYSIVASLPTSVATYPNGLPGPDIEYGYQPIVTPSFLPGFNDNKDYKVNVMLSADLKIPGVEGLVLSGYYAYDKNFGRTKLWEKPFTLYQLDEAAYINAGNTGSEDGSDFLIGSPKGVPEPRLTESFNQSGKTTVNAKLSYTTTIDEVHNIEGFVAYEHFEYDAEGFSAFRRYFISNQLPYLFAGGEDKKDNSGWVDLDAQMNYFGRLSYNYDDTYLFQFTFRRDGSLRFSEDYGRWGNFPSILLGYKPSEQDWWQNSIEFIDFFKLKASWGQMGNDQIPSFQYLSSYALGGGAVLGADKSYLAGLYQSRVPNPFITWEVANVYNVGFESNFLEHKVTFNVDFFYEKREDILIQRNASVPQFTGLSLPEQNFGIVKNRGFEVVLGYADYKEDWSYSVEGNLAFARNEIVEFDEPEQVASHQTLTGHPIGSFLIHQSIGRFQSEQEISDYGLQPGARVGDPIILDYDGDGELTNLDQIIYEKGVDPEVTFGVNFNVNYKNWRLGGLLQGVSNTFRGIGVSSLYKINLDRIGWDPNRLDTSVPIDEPKVNRVAYFSDADMENAAYMRMKNLNLSYTVPKDFSEKFMLQNLRISLSGQNLFLIYPQKDKVLMDPEIGGLRSYPLMKTYSLGLKVQF